jgi:TRAP-type C4-dicarboxylate transport system permease small subunit
VPGQPGTRRLVFEGCAAHSSAADQYMDTIRRLYDRVLEAIAAFLMAAVALIVVLGFLYRWAGLSLVWYDEVASISLAWLTYYAAALAALRGAHIGFVGFVNAMPPALRVAATLFASAVTIFFFVVLAVTGVWVMSVLGDITLVSLPEVSQRFVQSAIPISSLLFVIAELLRLPQLIREARRGPIVEHEIKEALESAGVAVDPPAGQERRP